MLLAECKLEYLQRAGGGCPYTGIAAAGHGRGARATLTIQISPVLPDAHIYLQRDAQRVSLFHVLADQKFHFVDFFFGDFKHQFIVDLQGHS